MLKGCTLVSICQIEVTSCTLHFFFIFGLGLGLGLGLRLGLGLGLGLGTGLGLGFLSPVSQKSVSTKWRIYKGN